jgi:hypothetical protein
MPLAKFSKTSSINEIFVNFTFWSAPHRQQDNARNESGLFYFEGKDIYSYGSHFRCASVVKNQKGETAYLVTTNTYSATTNRHMRFVRSAIPHNSRIFHTTRKVTAESGRLDEWHCKSALYYLIDQLKAIDACIAKQTKARLYDYSDEVKECLKNMSEWINFWGLERRQKSAEGKFLLPATEALLRCNKSDINVCRMQGLLTLIMDAGLLTSSTDSDFDAGVLQLFKDRSGNEEIWLKFEARQQRQFNARQKQQEEKERVSRMTFEQQQTAWKQGNTAVKWINVPSGYGFNAILRVRKGNVETSKGITIAPTEAVRLWYLVRRCHENETEFHKDMVHDSNHNKWAISSYRNDILTAGCHSIAYAEMEEAAVQLGVAS